MSSRFYINRNRCKDTDTVCEKIREIMHSYGWTESKRIKNADLCFSVGGDGTFIDTAGCMDPNAEIIGINMGTLGYLADTEPDEVEDMLHKYVRKEYCVQERMCINAHLQSDDTVPGSVEEIHKALNDIVVTKNNSSVIDIEIFVNRTRIIGCYADGVIVSTPTGSTGYAFSCGAPFIDPSSSMIIITLIAPHTIMNRSIIVSSDSTLIIKIRGARGDDYAQISYDGQKEKIKIGSVVNICKSVVPVKMVKFGDSTSFLDRIAKKMS